MELSKNALTVLEKRYLKKDKDGNVVETPEDMIERISFNISGVEEDGIVATSLHKEFMGVMKNLEFLPNSPTLMNAGRDLQQLSACFVLPVEDSMEGIFESVKQTAVIHKSGGGTGFSFGRLRPKGDLVGSTKGVSSGPVSFMKVFNASTEAVKQGGTRRGANMGILPVNHPDILEFITCKQVEGELNNFNISVAITDDFMEAVKHNREYPLVHPVTKESTGVLNAKEVFNLIVKTAHATGDPGIVFIDRLHEGNPTPSVGTFEATNPCGEQPLLPYESCNLGSINLTKIYNSEHNLPDMGKLAEISRIAVRFLDNVISANKYPIKQIEEQTLANRKIGLGVMGWADLLCMMGIPYDSDRALSLGKEIMRHIKVVGSDESHKIALEKGSFPNHDRSIYNEPMRNATITTIAPTGTLSIIANCSSGIEPIFALAYTRHILDGEVMTEVNPIFERVAKERDFYSEDLMKKIAKTGSVQGLEEVPADVRNTFKTSHDISPEWHVRMQAAFQVYTDNAVSKTVNFHNDATIEDVEKSYMLAYDEGCKGITIFRDGSKSEQVLKIDHQVKEEVPVLTDPRKRGNVTFGMTERIKTGCGYLYVTINEDESGPCEVLTTIGKAGGCATAQTEGIGRLTSVGLRYGVPLEKIVHHLRGLRCNAPAFIGDGKQVLSCPDALAMVVDNYLKNRYNYTVIDDKLSERSGACPECGSVLEQESGCVVCRICGFSKCH